MKFAVLNPGGRDAPQSFPKGAGLPTDPGHPPINYHAYAACMQGGFFNAEKQIPQSVENVLILLRRDLKCSLQAIERLKKRKIRCFISWKESGAHQVATTLDDSKRLRHFFEVCKMADGFISSTEPLTALYQSSGCAKGEFIPTPYPVCQPEWDFGQHVENRQGIFIGTREFDVPSRNHLAAVIAACALAERLKMQVTCVAESGRGTDILKVLAKRFPCLRIQKGRLPYPEYLTLLARHRVVFQWDQSEVPGQVAGDAALCRIPCVGGNSAIEKLAFRNFSGALLSRDETLRLMEQLLTNDAFYRQSCETSLADAQKTVSCEVVRKTLLRF